MSLLDFQHSQMVVKPISFDKSSSSYPSHSLDAIQEVCLIDAQNTYFFEIGVLVIDNSIKSL